MKHITKHIPYSESTSSSLVSLTGWQQPLFLDIETTGLSSERNHIYLIGCCHNSQEGWEFHQWFSEGPEEEEKILRDFLTYLQNFQALVHFNGSTFDIPFIRQRCEHLSIPCSLDQYPALDLFREARLCRNLLHLPNMKQKTIENFLSIFREDQMSGGDLIAVYRKYVKKPDPEAAHLLLLHNEEDILDMPRLLPILVYRNLACGKLTVDELLHLEIEEGEASMTVDLKLDLSLPAPIFLKHESWTGILKKNLLHLTLPVYTGQLKYFFSDYRNYYYLPQEDTAIHKSVAEFVDKDYRQKASKETAYTRHSSCYAPYPAAAACCRKNAAPASLGEEVRLFREEFGSQPYVDTRMEDFRSPDFWTGYVKELLGLIV